MRPVAVCHGVTFLVRVRGTLICRGGIYASRQGGATARGLRLAAHFRRTLNIFKIVSVRRDQGPALQYKANALPSRQRAVPHRFGGRHLCRPYAWTKRGHGQKTGLLGIRPRAACTPALHYKINVTQPINGRCRQRFAGGMYAAPTHGSGAVAAQKPHRRATGQGPHACGPCHAGKRHTNRKQTATVSGMRPAARGLGAACTVPRAGICG